MDIKETKLSDIMTRDPLTVSPDDTVLSKVDIFKSHHIHHIPVVNAKGEVLGMVSQKDFENFHTILEIIENPGEKVTIKDIMTEPIFSYYEDVSVSAAAQAMIDNHIHAIVVADQNEKMVGIVTSTDLIRLLAKS